MDTPSAKRPGFMPATFRRIGKERTDEGLVLTVFCPKQTAVVPISDCRACPNCNGLSIDTSEGDSFLRCNYVTPQPQPFEPLEVDARVEREPTVGDLMTSPVRCVTKDTSAETLLRLLLEDGISAVPVINAEGRPVGLVSKSDLLREQVRGGLTEDMALWTAHKGDSSHGAEPADADDVAADPLEGLTVAELMTPFAFSLPVDAPVSLACALMSYEAVHRIAVTEKDGTVVGVLSSLDVMRWIAVDRGYTVPPRRRKQRV